jgi:hypothetical protein
LCDKPQALVLFESKERIGSLTELLREHREYRAPESLIAGLRCAL